MAGTAPSRRSISAGVRPEADDVRLVGQRCGTRAVGADEEEPLRPFLPGWRRGAPGRVREDRALEGGRVPLRLGERGGLCQRGDHVGGHGPLLLPQQLSGHGEGDAAEERETALHGVREVGQNMTQ
ncbi:hypothetical protein [Streptomyces sp. DG1A-41]|uniref:hypothetical protein n=1 Tax=Streptomyces sp. DG1A-41 TaxID=3125779 RepID=UPI0030D0A188